ncbi:MAG TPA: hypothetical protein VGB22_09710 [candidate division Zixibacteria bacterium]|jgi:exopolyphosphatase/guanosine-5'-triphosphate,3'-diphosphate pyrophosphatase
MARRHIATAARRALPVGATVGVCDLGTFSCLFLMARVSRHGLVPLEESRHTIDLLAGMAADCWITHTAQSRAMRAVAAFSTLCRGHACARSVVVCTAAIRSAPNRRAVVAALRHSIRHRVIVLSARTEARLTAIGALSGLTRGSRPSTVIDVGGGSTEIINTATNRFVGIPIGAARATDTWGRKLPRNRHERSRHHRKCCEQDIAGIPIDCAGQSTTVVGVGGTITTLAAISMRLKSFDADAIHGRVLTLDEITRRADEFSLMTRQQLAALIPFDPRRARVLTAGTHIWAGVLNALNAPGVRVSVRGLRWGAADQICRGIHLPGLRLDAVQRT